MPNIDILLIRIGLPETSIQTLVSLMLRQLVISLDCTCNISAQGTEIIVYKRKLL